MAERDITIELSPEAVVTMCAAAGRDLPEWAVSKLSEADQKAVKEYHRMMALRHWHVKDNTHDIAFPTETAADEFANQMWHWITGGDEDHPLAFDNDVETYICHKPKCRIYVG